MTRGAALGRRRLAVVAGALAALVAVGGPAEAHRLKLFVTALDGEISGYAFFVGGGRPDGVEVFARDATGAEVFRGRTDDSGAFRWRAATPVDHVVTVDAGDGHRVEGTISGDRLGAVAGPLVTPSAANGAAAAPAVATGAGAPDAACAAPVDAAALAALVDRAVARQLRPLIEAIDQAEGRVRVNDLVGGVGMIAGLAGAGLWAMSRRRRNEGDERR